MRALLPPHVPSSPSPPRSLPPPLSFSSPILAPLYSSTPLLPQAFEGIANVKFESDLKISEMIAAAGERVVMDVMVDPEKGKNKVGARQQLKKM